MINYYEVIWTHCSLCLLRFCQAASLSICLSVKLYFKLVHFKRGVLILTINGYIEQCDAWA